MPATEVKLCNGDESLRRVFDLGNRKHDLRMCHEAASAVSLPVCPIESRAMQTHFVIRSSIDRGSRMKVGRVTRLKSAPGRS